MFYIKQSLEIFKKHIGISLGFIVIGWVLLGLSLSKQQANDLLLKMIPKNPKGSQFHALIQNESNPERLVRLMKDMPAVKVTKILPQEKIKEEVQGVFQELEIDVDLSLNLTAIEVEFNNDSSLEERESAVKYFRRISGESLFMLGEIQNISASEASFQAQIEKYKDSLFYIPVAFLVVIWISFCFRFSEQIARHSFMLERFQRRKKIAQKLFVIISALLVTPIIIGVFLNSIPSIPFSLITFFILSLMFYTMIATNRGVWK